MSSVDRLFEDLVTLKKLLLEAKELSLLSSADDIARKTLLIAAASSFEDSVRAAVIDYFREKSGADERVVAFVEKKGLERQFHTLFDWDQSNANRFFGLFGSTYQNAMKRKVTQDKRLAEAIAAFMEIGRERKEVS